MQGGAVAVVLFVAGQAAPAGPALDVQVTGVTRAKAPIPKAPAQALKLYGERCAMCHGPRGAGDGPAAAGMMTKPRRFSNAVWQDSVDDAHLQKAIVEGGFAVKRSTAMPPHPDLREHGAALVQLVRSFRSPTGSVTVDVHAADGKLEASGGADADKDGRCAVRVPLKRPLKTVTPHTVHVRVSARGEPACTIELADLSRSVTVTCDASARPVAAAPTEPAGAVAAPTADVSPGADATR